MIISKNKGSIRTTLVNIICYVFKELIKELVDYFINQTIIPILTILILFILRKFRCAVMFFIFSLQCLIFACLQQICINIYGNHLFIYTLTAITVSEVIILLMLFLTFSVVKYLNKHFNVYIKDFEFINNFFEDLMAVFTSLFLISVFIQIYNLLWIAIFIICVIFWHYRKKLKIIKKLKIRSKEVFNYLATFFTS